MDAEGGCLRKVNVLVGTTNDPGLHPTATTMRNKCVGRWRIEGTKTPMFRSLRGLTVECDLCTMMKPGNEIRNRHLEPHDESQTTTYIHLLYVSSEDIV